MFIAQGQNSIPLGYEMNAHPASTVRDLLTAVEKYVVPIRDKVCPGEPFAIAPHIGQGLAGCRDVQCSETDLFEQARECFGFHILGQDSFRAPLGTANLTQA